jgi:hypothetical protein
MYLIIKDPFYKEENDCIPLIRVDNIKDIIFDVKYIFSEYNLKNKKNLN